MRQRMRATWPDTERIVTMTTGLIRFTQRAHAEPRCRFNALMGLMYDPEGLHASFERQAGKKAPGVILNRCGRLRLGAEWCNAPCSVLRGRWDVPTKGIPAATLQIRTLRSVGIGGRQLPPMTRWVASNGCLYPDSGNAHIETSGHWGSSACKADEGWILTRPGETMDELCESTVWGVASAFDRQILAGAMPVSSATHSIPVSRPDVI